MIYRRICNEAVIKRFLVAAFSVKSIMHFIGLLMHLIDKDLNF